MAARPPKSAWLEDYEREQAKAFAKHSAQQGRDWGPHGDWAFEAEKAVRRTLSEADRDIARILRKDPAAVRSSYSPAGRAQDWAPADWGAVLVGTESGIGDPYEYERTHEAFERAVELLNSEPFYREFTWSWESINPAVHVFRATPIELQRHNPPRVYRMQKVVSKLERSPPAMLKPGMIVRSPEDLVRNTLSEYLSEKPTEVFLVLHIDIHNKVIGYTEYAAGSVSSVQVDAAGVMRDALLSGAAGVVTVHNHPSGDPTPSQDDRALWNRLRSAGQLLGVPVVDNLVVGEGRKYFSESEESR